MNQLLDSDRLAHLASLFVTPEAGTSPPDSMGYGDPLDWGAYAPYVALRQQGMPAEDVVRIMPADLRGELFQHDAGSAGVAPLTTLSAKYLLTATWPEPVWVVPELLPAGLAFLAGRPKLGKSWLALQIALGAVSYTHLDVYKRQEAAGVGESIITYEPHNPRAEEYIALAQQEVATWLNDRLQ